MESPAHVPKDSFKFSIFTSVRTLMNKLWTHKGFHKNSIKNKNKKIREGGDLPTMGLYPRDWTLGFCGLTNDLHPSPQALSSSAKN